MPLRDLNLLWNETQTGKSKGELSAGEKFADADLMGMPYRIVVSKKTIESGAYEVKVRNTGEVEYRNDSDLQSMLAN